MGIGTERGKGTGGEFAALEALYTKLARTADGQQKLRDYVLALEAQPGKTTCDLLPDLLGLPTLARTAIEAVNRAWYGRGPDGSQVVSQWHSASTANPAQIQLVNRQAVAHYLARLVELATENAATWIEIWGQCVHPDFSIGVRTMQNEAGVRYLMVDYRVPLNDGGYGRQAGNGFSVLDDANRYRPADPALVGVWDELPEGRRFFYASDHVTSFIGTMTSADTDRARDNAKEVHSSVLGFAGSGGSLT